MEIDIRDAFFDALYDIGKADSRVIFMTGDLGAFGLVKFQNDLPNQYINAGIAEQNMASVAAGLALGGKKVFIYSVVPFATERCYEQISIDICAMNLPVTIIGIGPGFTYASDGPTHHGTQDIAIMRALPNLTILNPSTPKSVAAFAHMAYKNSGPTYIRLDKGKIPELYKNVNDFSDGLAELKKGKDLTIIATGNMVHYALKAADEIKKSGQSIAVVDLYRIKPLNQEKLLNIIDNSKRIVSLEESILTGGIGSAISEFLTDHNKNIPFKRLAIRDEYCFRVGTRENLQAFYNLDVDGVIRSIREYANFK